MNKQRSFNLPNKSQNRQLATVYVRNNAKKVIMLILPKKTTLSEILQKIQSKFKIDSKNQRLFLHGKVIQSQKQQIALDDRYIFYVVDMNRVNQLKIAITVKKDTEIHNFQVFSEMKIGDFIQDRLSIVIGDGDKYNLLYLGKELQKHNTFQQEYVEDQSEINCVKKQSKLEAKYFTGSKFTISHQDALHREEPSFLSERTAHERCMAKKTFENLSCQENEKASSFQVSPINKRIRVSQYSLIRKFNTHEQTQIEMQKSKYVVTGKYENIKHSKINEDGKQKIKYEGMFRHEIIKPTELQLKNQQQNDDQVRTSQPNPQELSSEQDIQLIDERKYSVYTNSKGTKNAKNEVNEQAKVFNNQMILESESSDQSRENSTLQKSDEYESQQDFFYGLGLTKIDEVEEGLSRGQSLESNPSTFIMQMVKETDQEKDNNSQEKKNQKQETFPQEEQSTSLEIMQHEHYFFQDQQKKKGNICNPHEESSSDRSLTINKLDSQQDYCLNSSDDIRMPFLSQKVQQGTENPPQASFKKQKQASPEENCRQNVEEDEEDNEVSIQYLEQLHGKVDEEEDEVIIINQNVFSAVYGAVPSSKKSISLKPNDSIKVISLNITDHWECSELPEKSQLIQKKRIERLEPRVFFDRLIRSSQKKLRNDTFSQPQ